MGCGPTLIEVPGDGYITQIFNPYKRQDGY